MAEIMDDVVHLSQEIGPHPAGTEEEQQAALYLAEEIQKESGFPAVIEDFQCVTNYLLYCGSVSNGIVRLRIISKACFVSFLTYGC